MNIQDYVEEGIFSPKLISDVLFTTQSDIANTLGLTRSAFSHAERRRAEKTQTRLWEMLEILDRVEQFTGSPLASYAWFRSEPITGFGGHTASRLVREGHADYVHEYLDRKQAGRYA